MNEEDKNNSQNLHTWIDPELEVRIVALVLGEASDFERGELERIIAEKPELIAFQRRIEEVHGILCHEKEEDNATSPSGSDWKLSGDKRSQLEAVFSGKAEVVSDETSETNTVIPIQKTRKPRSWNEIAKLVAAVAILIGVGAILPVTYLSMNESSRMAAGFENTDHFYFDFDANAPAPAVQWADADTNFAGRTSRATDGGETTFALNDSERTWDFKSDNGRLGDRVDSLETRLSVAGSEVEVEVGSRFGETEVKTERLAVKSRMDGESDLRRESFEAVDREKDSTLFESRVQVNPVAQGMVALDGAVISNSGEMTASNGAGAGGRIETGDIATLSVDTNGVALNDPIAATNGDITVSSGATIDASGKTGGGSVSVSGGFTGSDAVDGKAPASFFAKEAVPGQSGSRDDGYAQLGHGGRGMEVNESKVPDVAALYGDFDNDSETRVNNPGTNKPVEGNAHLLFARPEMEVADSGADNSKSFRFLAEESKQAQPQEPSAPEPEAPKRALSLLSRNEPVASKRDFEGEEDKNANSNGVMDFGTVSNFRSMETKPVAKAELMKKEPAKLAEAGTLNELQRLNEAAPPSGGNGEQNLFRSGAAETPPADHYAYFGAGSQDKSAPRSGEERELKQRQLAPMQKFIDESLIPADEAENTARISGLSDQLAQEYYEVARDQTRATFMSKIAEGWEMPVPVGADPLGKSDVAMTESPTVAGAADELKSHGNVYSLGIDNGGTVRAAGETRTRGTVMVDDLSRKADYTQIGHGGYDSDGTNVELSATDGTVSFERQSERARGGAGLDSDGEVTEWSERSLKESEESTSLATLGQVIAGKPVRQVSPKSSSDMPVDAIVAGEPLQEGNDTFSRQYPGGANNLRGFDYRDSNNSDSPDVLSSLDVTDSDFINGGDVRFDGATTWGTQPDATTGVSKDLFDLVPRVVGGGSVSGQQKGFDNEEEYLRPQINIVKENVEFQAGDGRNARFAKIGHGGTSLGWDQNTDSGLDSNNQEGIEPIQLGRTRELSGAANDRSSTSVARLAPVYGNINTLSGIDSDGDERAATDGTKALEGMQWLNSTPYRKTDPVYLPGLEFGTTDVVPRFEDTTNQSWFGRTQGNRPEMNFGFDANSDSVNPEFALPIVPPPANLDELTAADEAFSTFSLNVSDVSFKLAKSALEKGEWPEADKIRIEEFVNAFDYGDPLPSLDDKVACRVEQSIHPFIQQRNLVRVAMRTGAAGRAADTPLRLTFLLDNSGSMERPDRKETVNRAFSQLASQLQPADQVTVIRFARQPHLLADRVTGDKSADLVAAVRDMPSEGGTNLEAAIDLAFEKAKEQQVEGAQNRIVLLTDGAANLGNAKPEILAKRIHEMREAGIAFDAAGIVADGLNDDILEALTRKGDGRYYLLDNPDDADAGFAKQIAGALRPSAGNVKVQVEFNPDRVGRYKLLGFEKHRLNKEDFRNDAVDAAELAAEEAGVAVYQVETLPEGQGDIGSVSVRFRDFNSDRMVEKLWPIAYDANAPRPDQADASMRIATAASMFAAKLKGGPLGDTVELAEVAKLLEGLPKALAETERVGELRAMVQKAQELTADQ